MSNMKAQLRTKLVLASELSLPQPLVVANCVPIYAFLSGSRAYGINDEDSDYDLVSVFIAPLSYYFGLNTDKIPDAAEIKDRLIEPGLVMGVKYYELKHFVQLALKNNPNVLEGFWAEDDCVLYCNDIMSMIKSARKSFLSTERACSAYKGYAYDQLLKMTRASTPTGRMGAKRKEIMEKYGYDIKNAVHLVRLLYTAIDVIENQQIKVRMEGEQRDMLMSVKKGQFPLDELNSVITRMSVEIEERMKKARIEGKIVQSEPKSIEQVLVAALRKHFVWL